MSSLRPVPARRGRPHLLRHVRGLWLRRRRDEGTFDALRSIISTARAVRHRQTLGRLFSLELFDRHVATSRQVDALFAVSHQHFLSRALSVAQRVECAESHFRFESAHGDAIYQAAVYAECGLPLWHVDAGGTRYSIVLRHSGDLHQEGPVSVSLLAGEAVLHVISFAWVPEQLLVPPAAAAAWLMFVTRSQSAHVDAPAMVAFSAAFPHNAPSYFCMAAVLGIAQAQGQVRIAGVTHQCQIAYKPELAAGFRRSYCELWRSFGGLEATSQVHLMPVPARLVPLSAVAANHRTRARSRRQHWAAITQSSISTLQPHLLPQWLPARPPQLPVPALGEQLLWLLPIRWARQLLPSLLTFLPAGVL